jgi:hypothetical protein
MRWDPQTYCLGCHGDTDPASPSYGLLTGSELAGYFPAACTSCHNDPSHLGDSRYVQPWQTPAASLEFAQDSGSTDTDLTPDAYTGTAGEAVSFKAAVRMAEVPAPGRYGGPGTTLTYQFMFGDGTPADFPVDISFMGNGVWNGLIEATHTFDAPGTYSGSVAVSDGETTVYETFTVDIGPTDPLPAPDSWDVDENYSDPFEMDFEITFEAAGGGVGGDFSAIKDSSTVAFGTESGGVIFWMDLVFAGGGWSIGNVYFGNVDYGAGVMDGVLIKPDGIVEVFHGVAN